MKILTFLAEGFEETEAVTVMDLLIRAGFEVEAVSVSNEIVISGAHGIKLKADSLLSQSDVNSADAIFLPGGVPGVPNLTSSPQVLEIIKNFDKARKWIFAICAAPSVLEAAGVLKGRTVTCYPSWAEKIKSAKVVIITCFFLSRAHKRIFL